MSDFNHFDEEAWRTYERDTWIIVAVFGLIALAFVCLVVSVICGLL
jgi:ABC-type antimicrobial peptide transport system permease subunit